MAQVLIQNPILDSPFEEPTRQFDRLRVLLPSDPQNLYRQRDLLPADWVRAINNQGGFGRRTFVEIDDPWNAQAAIRATLDRTSSAGRAT